ncbi:MAG: fructosamine kinase family protein [Bacteroidota bacterium]
MPVSEIVNYLKQILGANVQSTIVSLDFSAISGGSINETYKVRTGDNRTFFLKINSASALPLLFHKEKNGLEFLARQKIISIPRVIHYSITDNYQLLLLEWIEQGLKTGTFWKNFGEQLARLHKKTNNHLALKKTITWALCTKTMHIQKTGMISLFINVYSHKPGLL